MKQFLFLGDSITDCYHSFDPENLGEGYVRLISENFQSANSDITVINKGFDGFTLSALKRLWNQQSAAFKPDLITILIGINDVCVMENTHDDISFALAEFKLGYKTFIDTIRKTYSGPIILMEPFLFPYPEAFRNWFETVKKMTAIIKNIARQYHLIYIPLWETLLQKAEASGYDTITTDGIHLTESGHQILAQNWLDVYNKFIFQ